MVRPELTREIAGRWGAQHELVPVERSGDPFNHVIAGDALSPATTQVLADRIVAWVKAVAGLRRCSGLSPSLRGDGA